MKILWIMLVLLFFHLLQFQFVQSNWISRTFPNGTPNDTFRNFFSIANFQNVTYVGARNYLLAIDRNHATYKRIFISVNQEVLRICKSFYPSQADTCGNSLIMVEKVNESTLFFCGTNVQYPRCYFMNIQTSTITTALNKASRYIPEVATVHVPGVFVSSQPRSQAYNALCLTSSNCNMFRFIGLGLSVMNKENVFRSPTFLDMYHVNQKVYLFYRDVSNVFENDGFTKNGQNNEYGLVARVCHSDIGGKLLSSDFFMTFMRARLLCPYVNKSSRGVQNILYYNNLKYTYKVGSVVYGLFTLPNSWSFKSIAICAFDFDTIDSHIDGSAYPNSDTTYYNPDVETLISRYTGQTVPNFLPGQCPGAGYTTKDTDAAYVDFIRTKTIVSKAVRPIGGSPSYVATNENYDFVTVLESGGYHVLYLFKENGYLRRVRAMPSSNESLVLGESRVLPEGERILSLSAVDQTLMIVTNRTVRQLNPSSCASYDKCQSCQADPFCTWARSGESFTCENALGGNRHVGLCFSEPPAPRNFTVHQASSTLSLRWLPGNASHAITQYSVKISAKSSGDLVVKSLVSSPMLTINASNLEDGVNYLVDARSINTNTYSNERTSFTFSKAFQSPPLTVRDIQESSATLTWTTLRFAKFYNVTVLREERMIRSFLVSALGYDAHGEISFPVAGLSSRQYYEVQMTTISTDNVQSTPSTIGINTTIPTTVPETTTIPETTSTTPAATIITTTTTTTTTITTTSSTDTNPITLPTSVPAVSISSSSKQNQFANKKNTTNRQASLSAKSSVLSLTTTKSEDRITPTTKADRPIFFPQNISDLNKDGPAVNFFWPFIIFFILSILLAVIVLFNYCSYGAKTNVLIGEKESTRWKRKLCFLWIADKGTKGSVV